MKHFDVALAIQQYDTGKYTVKELAAVHGISVGKMFQDLKAAGCKFNRKARHPLSIEARRHIGEGHKGKKISEEQKRQISLKNSCNYNGLNGYGHTKRQNTGYILAYAPKHPNARADGYLMLHRVLMEQHIGRYLEPNEVVHHINHVRDDNNIENLALMDKHDHMSMHMRERHAKRRNDLLTS